jgi:hypothetical protein
MVPQRPLALTLPGLFRWTRLVLQWCGAGFTTNGHQSSSRGLIAIKQYANAIAVSHAAIIVSAIRTSPTHLRLHPTDTARRHQALALAPPIGRNLHLAANLQKAAAG